ncbi:hypothetical protein CTAYLR_004645 [Chrysophaeum taylorii]|uniref:Ste24 endopeptidase n=1 Tax=Chrysophaeum taylorii TaxID=2483200 RepID=A0AAD7UP60_9STRA|nr:hypothetical protein CTAYLR_004645 [Chrysophaeum taylorii]
MMEEVVVKINVIGDLGVGKSSLLGKFCGGPTVGMDICEKHVVINRRKVVLQCWDTAGQERYRTISSSYYRGVHGVIVVFDVSARESFSNVKQWLHEVDRYAHQDVRKVIVGNKCDLTEERWISTHQAQELAASIGVEYVETSAKTGRNVELVFEIIAAQALTWIRKEDQMAIIPYYRQDGHEDAAVPYLMVSLIFGFVLHLWESYLDFRQHVRTRERGDKVPPELRTLVAKLEGDLLSELEEKAPAVQAYALAKSRFKFVAGTWELLQSTMLACAGAHAFVWDRCALTDGEIKNSLVFCAAWVLYSTVTSLPFEAYSTFVIEQKHGFNKTTVSLFFIDKVKTLALTAALGGPVVAALLGIIRAVGPQFLAVYVGAFMLCVSLFFVTIFPVWIQPLFNKYEPLEDGELRAAIEDLAASVHYPLYKLFTVDGSLRSSHSNAYMYGFFKFKRIVLYDTLLKQAKTDEIVAILAHELGHWSHGHTVVGFVVMQLYTLASFSAFSKAMADPSLYRSFGFRASGATPTAGAPVVVGLFLFFTTLWEPVDHLLSFLLTINSRRMEFQADQAAS